jgi:hypothetical protein
LTGVRLIASDKNGRFTLGAVLGVKMASALLDPGVPAASSSSRLQERLDACASLPSRSALNAPYA